MTGGGVRGSSGARRCSPRRPARRANRAGGRRAAPGPPAWPRTAPASPRSSSVPRAVAGDRPPDDARRPTGSPRTGSTDPRRPGTSAAARGPRVRSGSRRISSKPEPSGRRRGRGNRRSRPAPPARAIASSPCRAACWTNGSSDSSPLSRRSLAAGSARPRIASARELSGESSRRRRDDRARPGPTATRPRAVRRSTRSSGFRHRSRQIRPLPWSVYDLSTQSLT